MIRLNSTPHETHSGPQAYAVRGPFSVEIRDLKKTFVSKNSTLEVLKNINLSILQPSIVGFIGKSGAGKTTLLRCLNLLERPSSGQVLIGGKDLIGLSELELKKFRQKIGMVFQSFNLLNNSTVYRNLALPLEILGLPTKQIASKVADVAALVGLEAKLTQYPGQLSGGQKQRVAIARALISDASILLCDEFTSALDPETTVEILDLIRDIHTQLKVTVILISHDMAVVNRICDYVYVVDAGQIVEQGPTSSVLSSPQHPATRSLTRSNTGYQV